MRFPAFPPLHRLFCTCRRSLRPEPSSVGPSPPEDATLHVPSPLLHSSVGPHRLSPRLQIIAILLSRFSRSHFSPDSLTLPPYPTTRPRSTVARGRNIASFGGPPLGSGNNSLFAVQSQLLLHLVFFDSYSSMSPCLPYLYHLGCVLLHHHSSCGCVALRTRGAHAVILLPTGLSSPPSSSIPYSLKVCFPSSALVLIGC